MAKFKNSFLNGMDKDSSKNKYDNQHYYDANNVRITSQEGLSGGALEDIEGSLKRIDISGGVGNQIVIGSCVLRDDVIIFLTDNFTNTPTGGSTDYIIRIPVEELEGLTGTNVVTVDFVNYHKIDDPDDGYNLIYTGNMWFCSGNPIQAIPRYENIYVKKVYWVDDYNPLRYINIVYDAELNDIENLPLDHLEVVPDVELTQPFVKETTGGDLNSGKIQYAYQLYLLNGSKTAISPPSPLVHLTSSSDNEGDSLNYNGDKLAVNTGKGCEIEIPLESTNFTRLRLFAIHYSTYEDEPEIRIVTEVPILIGDESVILVDTGESVGTVTLEEYRTFSGILSPATIETKDNILFIGNTEETLFDVEYDARAYRFGGFHNVTTNYNYNPRSTSRISVLYNIDDTYYAIYPAGMIMSYDSVVVTDFGLTNRLFNSLVYEIFTQATTDFTSYGAADNNPGTVFTCVGYPSLGAGDAVEIVDGYILYDNLSSIFIVVEIPEEADCINKGNNMDYDAVSFDRVWNQRYQEDGAILGGEGINVSYDFVIEEIQVCLNQVTNLGTWSLTPLKKQERDGGVDNFSYKGYSSPIYGGGNLVSYQRDETYRFGIVFFNQKGQSSFTKWIGDIRMPSINAVDTDSGETFNISAISGDTDDVLGRILTVRFAVTNIPAEATDYQIVRVKRELSDRSIVAQGMTVNAQHQAAWDPSEFRTCLTWGSIGFLDDDSVLEFFSPEVTFQDTPSYKAATDHVVAVGQIIDTTSTNSKLGGYCNGVPSDTANVHQWTYATYTQQAADDEFAAINISDCDGKVVHEDLVAETIFDDAGNSFDPKGQQNQQSTALYVFQADASFPPRGTFQNGRWLVNYRRNIHLSRYGGVTASTRARNEYQVAGEITPIATAISISKLGDTYINMSEFLIVSLQNDQNKIDATSFVFFVCESTINTDLRGPSTYEFTPIANRYLLHEYAGVWVEALSGDTYTQEENYYLYNKVYSRTSDLVLSVPKPFDWRPISEFDVRVYASLTKINGEFADSWLTFPVNQYIEVDPQHGPLTALKTVNNKLLFFQTQAFGVLSVNERALLETVTISQLSLGVADLLSRYDYAKTSIGCWHWRQLTLTPNGLYWVDLIGKAMYSYGSGPEEVSLMKGMDAWFRDNITNENVNVIQAMHMFYDPEYKEVYLIDNENASNFGLVYSEITDSFVSFTDIQPMFVTNYLDKTLGYTSLHPDDIYRHNDSNSERGKFYNSWHDVTLTLLINPSFDNISIFNNFEWLTESFDNSVDRPVTWDELQMWNDYQNTGSITLTIGQSVKRRMRKWRFIIPRALFLADGTTPADNRYSRMRDTHLFAKFTYTPDQTNDKMFIIHDIMTSHTISNR